ncbi:Hsp20/alpha crystallin family protein [Bacillus sp. PS06]|uniref:Hsp20/alpha crystallin family protein n=1 Tax=Bacillus sp. PS06 TaxID=2764176 RepID=UPI001781470F|nr:Hsp20/alpha crystallin family protein [Bacillus sp. PS06]MBD8068188.1 Hsp20/alpha crystallin family protein [Bacillus sp. PS06]
MKNEDNSRRIQFEGMEKWMEQFFDDPFTSISESFRVDLFETDEEYIIEAELPTVKKDNVQLHLVDDALIVEVKTNTVTSNSKTLKREILLPFEMKRRIVKAILKNNILEIFIQKNGKVNPPQSKIIIE